MNRTLICLSMLAAGTAFGQLNAEQAERCATRLSVAFHGVTAPATLLASATPQDSVEAMMQSPLFVDRFARFVNASFNDDPGETSLEDAPFHLTRYVLNNNRPWEELFIGAYNIQLDTAVTPNVVR